MVALAVVLHRQLPVAVLQDIFGMGNFAPCNTMRRHVRADRIRHGIEVVRRRIGHAHEQQSGQRTQMHLAQTVARGVE